MQVYNLSSFVDDLLLNVFEPVAETTRVQRFHHNPKKITIFLDGARGVSDCNRARFQEYINAKEHHKYTIQIYITDPHKGGEK